MYRTLLGRAWASVRMRPWALALALVLTAVLLLAGCTDTAPPGPTQVQPRGSASAAGQLIPDEYIVTFRSDVADVPGLAKQLVAQGGGALRFTYTAAIKGFAAHLPPQAVAALQNNPHVAMIEQDAVVRATGVDSPVASWGLDRIDQRVGPLDNRYAYANTGAGVSVYILDTGIRTTHVDFEGRASGAFTAINDGYGTSDCAGHGTHVAGLAGSRTYGVAKAVLLYSVRVLGCDGSGSTSGVVAGVDWVSRNRVLPAVANMSLGGSSSSTLAQAVQNSITAGVVYVVAAGNSSVDACTITPANVSAAITVGASNQYATAESYSNYGKCLDLFAPGRAVISTWYTSDTAHAGMSGTSMASPHVAGAAALYLAAHPLASPAEVAGAITGNATAGALTSVGTNSPNLLLYTGFIGAPADSQTPPPPPPPPPTVVDQPPTASFAYRCSKARCTFDASGSSDDQGIVGYTWAFGDGASASATAGQITITHTYQATGSFVVQLTVVDRAGQQNTVSQLVGIKRL